MAENPVRNLQAVETFFSALEARDLDTLGPLLSPSASIVIPFAPNGSTEPYGTHTGREAVLGYFTNIVKNFSQVKLDGKTAVVSADGGTVFLEGRGDLRLERTGAAYRNVYIFKFAFRDGGPRSWLFFSGSLRSCFGRGRSALSLPILVNFRQVLSRYF